MKNLPESDRAIVDIGKLRDYCLNPNHPEGRHKARVFLSALGVAAADSEWLAEAILAALPDAEAEAQSETDWGTLYRVDIEIARGRRCAKVRTGWICTAKETKFVTCFVIGECDETA